MAVSLPSSQRRQLPLVNQLYRCLTHSWLYRHSNCCHGNGIHGTVTSIYSMSDFSCSMQVICHSLSQKVLIYWASSCHYKHLPPSLSEMNTALYRLFSWGVASLPEGKSRGLCLSTAVCIIQASKRCVES